MVNHYPGFTIRAATKVKTINVKIYARYIKNISTRCISNYHCTRGREKKLCHLLNGPFDILKNNTLRDSLFFSVLIDDLASFFSYMIYRGCAYGPSRYEVCRLVNSSWKQLTWKIKREKSRTRHQHARTGKKDEQCGGIRIYVYSI